MTPEITAKILLQNGDYPTKFEVHTKVNKNLTSDDPWMTFKNQLEIATIPSKFQNHTTVLLIGPTKVQNMQMRYLICTFSAGNLINLGGPPPHATSHQVILSWAQQFSR